MSSQKVKNMRYIFHPKGIAVVGASTKPDKLGNIVLKHLIGEGFEGNVYPVNPRYKEVLGMKCYSDVMKIKGGVDCVIIATPANTVPKIIQQCGKKKIKGVIVLSGGFGEVGNVELEKQLKETAEKYDIACIGPNCLGVYDPYTDVDSIFFPRYKLERPRPGDISFVTQSGAVGECIMDLAAHYGIGVSKFISYGNGTVLDESDVLEYLENDKKTKQIVLYIEGVKDGGKLFKRIKKLNKKKPIVVLKAGKYGKALEAAMSHTGNIAGNYLAYKAAFRQTKVTEAGDIEELFDFVKIFGQPLPKGKRMGIITNGGGLGVLTTDAIEEQGLLTSVFSKDSEKKLRKIVPAHRNIGNPLDVAADAGVKLYKKCLDVFMEDKKVDGVIVAVLFQSPAINEKIIDVLVKACDDRRKPIAVVAVGGTYTDNYRRILEGKGVPTYGSPLGAVKAMKRFVEYSSNK